MRLINFGKALDAPAVSALAREVGEDVEVTEIAHVLDARPLPNQVYGLVAGLGIDPRQTYVVILPDNALFAALLVAAIRHAHGHYPWVATWQSGLLEVYALSALYPNKRENR